MKEHFYNICYGLLFIGACGLMCIAAVGLAWGISNAPWWIISVTLTLIGAWGVGAMIREH